MIFKRSPKTKFKNILPDFAQYLVNNQMLEKNFFYPRYEQYLKDFENQLPPLKSNDAKIVKDLRQHGISVTSLSELEIQNTTDLTIAANQILEELEEIAKKQNIHFAVTSNFQKLVKYPALFEWGLEERLISIAANYIGLPIAYDTFMCNFSTNNGKETATRLWHLDNEDRKMLKIIIYFNDVDDEGGPFQYMHPEVSALLLKKVKNKYRFFCHQEVEDLIPKSEQNWLTTYTGPSGTVIIVDTARSYHRGKPPTKCPRRAVSFGYLSRRPHQPFRAGRNLLSREELSQLTVGLSEEKQACATWQDSLPALARWIPKYSYV